MANDLNKELSIINNTLKGMNTNLNSIRKNLYDISRQLRIMNARDEKMKDEPQDYDAVYDDVIEGGSVNEEVSADGGNSDAQ